MKRGLLLVCLASLGLVYLTNCNKTNTVASSQLRVFNIDPSLKAQDMYLNNAISSANLGYFSTNNYVAVQPGTYNIKFAPTGTTAFGIDYNIDFTAGKNYTMFLLNNTGQPQSEVFDESLLTLGIDTSAIRFFNFSPNAPQMDIATKNTDTSKLDTTITRYTDRKFNDIYSNRLYTNFITIPSGTYYIKFRYADTTLAFDSVLMTFGDRKSYTLLAHGYFDSSGVPPFTIDTLMH